MSADAPPEFSFDAEVTPWRGPSPYFFAPLPDAAAAEIRRLARAASYGWGVIPVAATVRGVAFTTSLFPRAETYFLPLKDAVRRAADVTAGDVIRVEMTVRFERRPAGRGPIS